MAFKTKVDYCGLAKENGALVCVSSTENKSASVAEAHGADGSFVAREVYGETAAPSCEYKPKTTWAASAATLDRLGKVHSVTDGGATRKFCFKSLTVNTSQGSEPTVSAGCEQVANDATDACLYTIPDFTLPVTHHAHILMDAFTLSGNGCHLQSANYNITCNVTKALKEGVCLAHDVSEGKVEVTAEILQVGDAAPTVTPGTGWQISSPLTVTNPDADYPSWSVTLVKSLAKHTPSAQQDS